MREADETVTWVVYKMTLKGKQGASEVQAVCAQAEWDAMERERPGYHTFVRGDIPNEAEAERLARGTAGDPKVRGLRR